MDRIQQRAATIRKKILQKKRNLFSVIQNIEEPKEPIDLAILSPRARRKHQRKLVIKRRKPKYISTMSDDDLIATKNNYKERGYLDYALKYVERLQLHCPENPNFLLEAADIYYELGNFTKAAAQYAEFMLISPGSIKIEYALFRAIESTFKTTPSYDRDQSRTLDALTLIQTYLNHKTFTKYLDSVKKIESACYEKLVQKEFYICNFYLNKEQFKPIVQRTKYIREQYLSHVPHIEDQIAAIEKQVPSSYWLTTDVVNPVNILKVAKNNGI